jgi:predicted O-methyltransferase YrrM
MAIGFWLARPVLLVHRLRYWMWERRNPDKPWLCPGTIEFCERNLRRDMRALEFGSGRSTRWFCSKVGHLTSIEHDAAWYAKVREELKAAGVGNVSYLHVPLDHDVREGERVTYEPAPRYVDIVDKFADRSLNLVIVDGHYRTHCVRRAVPKIAPGGYLLVDDINLWPSADALPIPRDWRIVDDSTNGIKRAIIWQAN